MQQIMILEGPEAITANMRHVLNNIATKAKVNFGQCFVVSVHNRSTEPFVTWTKQGNRLKPVPIKERLSAYRALVDAYVAKLKPSLLVTYDPVATYIASRQVTASVSNCRGSLYEWAPGLPMIVIDEPRRIVDTDEGAWVAVCDWGKIHRALNGTLRSEPQFRYRVAQTLDDLIRFGAELRRSPFIGVDTETSDNWIQCAGYTGWVDGSLQSYTIPLFNPLKPGGLHWPTREGHRLALQTIRDINDCEAVKILQNGEYDAAYFIRYRSPLRNFFVDLMHLWHSMYAMLPKSLDFIASICEDHVQYWKEDHKGERQERHRWNQQKLDTFWKYCALDAHHTTCSAMWFLPKVLQIPWALENYKSEFPAAIGPALHGSCIGLRVDRYELKRLRDKYKADWDAALQKLRVMTNNPNFNPASADQVAQLFYKVLGAKPVKVKGKEGGTDEHTLNMIKEQHAIIRIFAKAILDCREASKAYSTYCLPFIRGTRYHTSQNVAGAYTSRYSSSSFMWEGGNLQNWPDDIRAILVADPGMVLFDIDLTQSDAYYIAFHSQDENFIRTMTSGKDTHCVHAAHFFKETYDEVLRRYNAGEPAYAHKATGKRALTKRIVHGSNFQMAAKTLFTIMQREAVVAAAHAIGIRDAHLYSNTMLIQVCARFLEEYHVLYPRLRPWYKEIEHTLATVHRITTAHGWTCVFFGAATDPAVQRKATAFYGQGGTAGRINKAIDYLYWTPEGQSLYERGMRLLLQVHDSLVGQVPVHSLDILRVICRVLQAPVQIHGRTLTIPTAVKIGQRWGDKNMRSWQEAA